MRRFLMTLVCAGLVFTLVANIGAADEPDPGQLRAKAEQLQREAERLFRQAEEMERSHHPDQHHPDHQLEPPGQGSVNGETKDHRSTSDSHQGRRMAYAPHGTVRDDLTDRRLTRCDA